MSRAQPCCPVFPALPGPVWCCSVSLCLALSCPTLIGHGRPFKNLPGPSLSLLFQFCHGPPSLTGLTSLTLFRLALRCSHCPSRPYPVLLTMTGLAQPCAALADPSNPSRSCSALSSTARLYSTCQDLSCGCTAWSGPVHPCPELSGPIRPYPSCITYFSCHVFVCPKHFVNQDLQLWETERQW